jgi:lipopolysaccharide/colanic/teichoic acid biosynthesis glycosyltransferase
MQTNSLPLLLPNDHHHFLVPNRHEVIITGKSFQSFFYLGDKEATFQYFTAYFKTGVHVESFDQAIQRIFKLSVEPGSLPDVILIDTPLIKSKMNSLSFVLKSDKRLAKIPVIYNERHLDSEMIYELISKDIIDEATNINSWDRSFLGKLNYLKMLKKHQYVSLVKTSKKSTPLNWKKHFNGACKRIFDIVISSVLILLCLPVFAAIAVAIKIDSNGPVFYNSLRAGRGFRVFRFFKFRTMEVGADDKREQLAHLNQYCSQNGQPNFLKICNDPRVTKIGHFLRNTSLDELPQLFNVFLGDMSLVGNRPLPINEAATLTYNEAAERFMAPAGITGLWQVEKRSNEQMSASERIALDIEYARKHNFMMDMFILAKTPMAMFQKANV